MNRRRKEKGGRIKRGVIGGLCVKGRLTEQAEEAMGGEDKGVNEVQKYNHQSGDMQAGVKC